MPTDHQYYLHLLLFFSVLIAKTEAQFTEVPDQTLAACSGNTANLRWNFVTPDMISLQWFYNTLEMMSKVQTNSPTFNNNYNDSVVEFVADAEILLKALSTSSTGLYACKVIYLSGDEYSNATTLTVYDTFTSGLSCQYTGGPITCSKPDASVFLNATDGDGSLFDITTSPKTNGNYTICMYDGAIACRGLFPACTTIVVNIQESTTTVYPDTSPFSSFETSSSLESTSTNALENITNLISDKSKPSGIHYSIIVVPCCIVAVLLILAAIGTKKIYERGKIQNTKSETCDNTDVIELSQNVMNHRYSNM